MAGGGSVAAGVGSGRVGAAGRAEAVPTMGPTPGKGAPVPSAAPHPTGPRAGAAGESSTRPAAVDLLTRALLAEAPDDTDLLERAPGGLPGPSPQPDGGAPGPGRALDDVRRRRVVVVLTLVAGALLLGFSLTREPGDPAFVAATIALGLVWLVGARLSGHVPLGWWRDRHGRYRRPVLPGLAIGAGAVLVFVAGAVLVAQIPVLRSSVLAVLDHAQWSNLAIVFGVTLLNGVAEEAFFRGALFGAVQRTGASPARPRRFGSDWRPVLVSTALYTVVTAASGNVMLVFAAAVLGLLCGLHRRATGGILGPVLIHLVWSLSMLLVLRPLIELAS